MMKNTSTLSLLTRSVQAFPTLPAVVIRIMDLTSDPDSSVEDFMALIQCDPALTTLVLKLSNSAYYGQVREVSSIKQAISVLGINEIRNAVVGRAVFNSFKHIDGIGGVNIRELWIHAFLCGLAAHILTRNAPAPEDYFITGLIHDIGKLVILTAVPSVFLDTVANHRGHPHEIYAEEERVLGVSHGEIGMALLKRWMFPDKLVEAVGYHHHPEKAGQRATDPSLIYFADLITYYYKYSTNPDVEALSQDAVTLRRAQSAGILWNDSALAGYLDSLNSEKNKAEDIFSLMCT